MEKKKIAKLGLKSRALLTLTVFSAIGCLSKNQQVDQMYDGGSNLTSVVVEAPRSEKLSYNQMKLVLRVVDDAGNDTDSAIKSAIDIPEGSENVKMETRVYSDKYKVSLDFIDVADDSAEPKVVASSVFCKDPSHIKANSEIQNIVGDTYSLEIFVCTPDGTQNVKTEKDTTDVVIKPELIIDSEEEKSESLSATELALDQLVEGTLYSFVTKVEEAKFEKLETEEKHMKCYLKKGQKMKAKYLGPSKFANDTFKEINVELEDPIRGKNAAGEETSCPISGRVDFDQFSLYEL